MWRFRRCPYHINADANKTVLFGYCDDPEAMNVPVTVTFLSDTKLSATKPKSFPWAPTGPRGQYGLSTYHELEFKTPSPKSDQVQNPV